MIEKFPSLQKRPKLKPLDLGDVMVALINQQNTIDHTEDYKKMLGRRRNTQFHGENNKQQQQLTIPQFALKQLTQSQLLDYHIKNKTTNTAQYANILQKLNQKIKIAMIQYTDKLSEGQCAIQQLKLSLNDACNHLSIQRKYILVCNQRITKNYYKIVPTIRKINNIKKVIEVISIWGQSKLPYLFSINTAHPYHYEITDILQLFNLAEQKIQKNVSQSDSSSLKKILNSLKQKHSKYINSVYEKFIDSIAFYTNTDEYKIKYQQYIYIRDKGLCQDILTNQGIKKLIQKNSKSMFYSVLIKLTPNMNVDLLNQSLYIDFYDEIIQQFVIYFRNWHYITTFHLDNNTKYGNLFLQSRKLVFLILSNCISKSIQSSNKFISLQYKIKLQLVQKLQDYIQAGQKWMGNYQELQLPKIVINKLSKQLQNIFGLYNNLIKNILTQQLSVMALEAVDEIHPKIKIKNNNTVSEINYQKISIFLSSNSSHTTRIYSQNGNISNNIQKQFNKLPEPPQVKLKIGSTFGEMIIQYLERSKYLQMNKLIYITKITQHFQFILFMMYQVCTKDNIKQKLNTNLQNKISQILKQKGQQINVKDINEIYKIALLKKQYFEILQFLKTVGNKYDGIKIAGIIDVNKVYESNNNDIIQGYMKLVVRVVEDLTKILKWLKQCIPFTMFKNYRECSRFGKLQQILKILFKLILENNQQNLQKKYQQIGITIIPKLKWQIKKFNQQTANLYKQYRLKLLQIFRNNTLYLIIKIQSEQLCEIVEDKQKQIFYRSLLQCYGRIQKINDNGRQLIRMDNIDISKILYDIGVKSQKWGNWFDKYMDFTSQRSYKNVIEKVTKVGILYQPIVWKYQLLWIIGDLSSREKKQYYGQLVRIYLGYMEQIK